MATPTEWNCRARQMRSLSQSVLWFRPAFFTSRALLLESSRDGGAACSPYGRAAAPSRLSAAISSMDMSARRAAIRLASLIFGLSLFLVSATAEAHSAIQGIGSFWSGVAHLLTSFDQLAFLVGLAIWASFYEVRWDARVIGATFAAFIAGVF